MMRKQIGKTTRLIHSAIDEAVAEPCRVLPPEGLVSADIELILDLRQRGGVDGVGRERTIAVGGAEKGACRREDKLCVSNHSGVNKGRGNLIAGKCRTGEAVAGYRSGIGIVDLWLAIVGLVAGQLRVSRHQQIRILWL